MVVYGKDHPNTQKVVKENLYVAVGPECLNCEHLHCPPNCVIACAFCVLGYEWGIDKLCEDYYPNFDKCK